MEPLLPFAEWIKSVSDKSSNTEDSINKPLIPMAIIFNSFEERSQDKFGDIQLGYFEYLINTAPKYGIDLFICKREDLWGDGDKVKAYLNKGKEWIEIERDFPKVVYQREGSYRYDIYDHLMAKGVKLYQEIPMLRTVTNKIKTGKLIQDSSVLTPSTYEYSPEKVMEYLNGGKSCFLKPIYGQLGDGAVRLNPDFTLKISDKAFQLSKETIIDKLEDLIVNKWKLKLSAFLVQDLVDMPTYNDSVFDARVMIQKNNKGEIVYSAHMARIGAANKITSNIHTGGSFESLEKVLMSCYQDQNLVNELLASVKKGSIDICTRLDQEYGKFGELGLDWLFTKNGKAICIELNPRPGKYIFSKQPEVEKVLRDRVLEYLKYIHEN